MILLKTDATAYLWMKDKKYEVAGVAGTYVDNCLNAGDIFSQHHTEKNLWKFDSKPNVNDNFDFYGMHINSMSTRKFAISQPYYTITMNATSVDGTFDQGCRDHTLLSWMTHTGPDKACYANRTAQASEKTSGPAKV